MTNFATKFNKKADKSEFSGMITIRKFTRYVKRVLGMTPSQYKAKFSVKK